MNAKEIIKYYKELEKFVIKSGYKLNDHGYFDYMLDITKPVDVIRYFNAMIAIREHEQWNTGHLPKQYSTKDIYSPLYIGKIRIYLVTPEVIKNKLPNSKGGDLIEINKVMYRRQSKESITHVNN